MQPAAAAVTVKAEVPDTPEQIETNTSAATATAVKTEVQNQEVTKEDDPTGGSENVTTITGAKPARRQDSPENLIHVRNNQTAVFYARLGRRMLFGTEKPAQDQVIITGLGRATGTAVGAAALMCSDERVKAVSAKTELWESIPRNNRNNNGGRTTAPPPRRIPKITITVAKLPGASGGLSPVTSVSTVAAESPNTVGTVSA